MSGGGSGTSNTVTSVQQIPEFEQEASQQNQELARSIGSQDYPTYNGALIQGFDPWQQQGQKLAVNAANAYRPGLYAGETATMGGLDSSGVNLAVGAAGGQIGNALDARGLNAYSNAAAGQVGNAVNPYAVNAYSGMAAHAANNAQSLTNPNNVGAYMSPYIQQALAPQIQDLQLQLAGQQRGIDQQATQSNAFGDARQGAASALQNLYGDQALNQLVGTGYNNAYSQALSAMGQAQQTQLGAASQYGNLGNLAGQEQQTQLAGAGQLANLAGLQGQEQQLQMAGAGQYANLANILGTEQQTQLAGGNQLANMGQLAQQLGLGGANAVYNAGQQNQQLGQSELNAAYQQYLNQVNWPTQMLNVRESALSNSPYNIASAVTLPNANGVAQGFGGLTGLAGLLGSLQGGSGGGQNAPFGGQSIQTGGR